MKLINGDKDVIITSVLVALIILLLIWRPLVLLYQTPAPIDYGKSISETVNSLKYDADVYKGYLRAGERGGSPFELDRKVEDAMLFEKIDYTIYLFGIYLSLFIIYRYSGNSKSAADFKERNGILDYNIARFKLLNTGIRRLLVVLYVFCWLMWGLTNENGFAILFMLFAYWILVSIIVWIYDGFNKVNIDKHLS